MALNAACIRRGGGLPLLLGVLIGCTRPVDSTIDTHTGETGVENTDCSTPAACVPDEVGWRAIDSGYEETCAITSAGEVICWGAHEANPPPGTGWANVSVDLNSGCALSESGRVSCWGGIRGAAEDPVGVFAEIHAQDYYACGRAATSNEVTCWGSEEAMAGGRPPPGPFLDFDFYDSAGCGIIASKEADCWGYYDSEGNEVELRGEYEEASVSSHAACAIGDGDRVTCLNRLTAANLRAEPPLHGLSVGGSEVCVLHGDARHRCWDWTGAVTTPLESVPFKAISVGWYHGCGITEDDTLQCWGGLDR